MKWKLIISLIIVAIAAMSFLAYADYSNSHDDDKTIFNVSSEGPIPLSDIASEIRTEEYYQGYDNETVEWMESLGDKYVFVSSDGFVIMDKFDADKIPSVFACDVSFYEIFSANVLEKHSLASKNMRDVYYVDNVEYIKEDAVYYDV